MKIRKLLSVILVIIFIFLLFGIQVFAKNQSKLESIKESIFGHKSGKDPDGSEVTYTNVDYHSNLSINKANLKKAEDLDGYVSDKELSKKGGKYTRKELTTYQQYIESGDDKNIRHDIANDRLLWVFTSKFEKTQLFDGNPIKKASVTTVYDAETGNFLFVNVTSEDTKHKSELKLHVSKPEGQNYTVYKKIEDYETVKTVMDVLLNVSWENARVRMSHQPDYKIVTINTDPTISYVPVTYAGWLSPKKDILEVVIEGQSKYGKLTKKDSGTLLTIIETP
jgi:hypothetical protein